VLSGPNLGLALLSAVGFAAAYPELDLRTVLTAPGLALATEARTACVETVAVDAAREGAEHWFRLGTTVDPTFADLLERNSAGQRPTAVPVLVVHGQADELVPVDTSAALVRRMCANGDTTVHRVVYPGADHATVVISSLGDVVTWLRARLAGAALQTDC
jgi:pimeloyl-ACP methyl ester carboxylesterase